MMNMNYLKSTLSIVLVNLILNELEKEDCYFLKIY